MSSVTHASPPVPVDRDRLRRCLESADPAVLLAVLVQLTGDASLLDRFAGQISHVPDPPEMAAVAPAPIAGEIVDRLTEAVAGGARPDGRVDEELFGRLAALALGVPVPDEFVPMLLEQGGFRFYQPVVPRTTPIPATVSVAIVGAGLAGIAVAIAAARAGVAYEVFERNGDVGGTWHIQNYPGVAVDTPAAYYSLSSALNPDWSSYYPKGGEYQDYLRAVVDEHRIRDHTRFGTEVEALRWDDEAARWEIHWRGADGGRGIAYASAVVTAAGYLNRPKYPDAPGRGEFAGLSVHSSEWDPELDLAGKRVAVIGAGCTAVQIVDSLVGDVEHLTLFQRQPHWVAPRKRRSDTVPEERRWLAKHLPYYANWIRLKSFWGSSDNAYPVVVVDPEWAEGHLSISPANDFLLQDCLAYIDETFGSGSELARKVTPDFAPFGKRIIRDPGGYYRALTRPDVDVEVEAIDRIVPDGIVTADGRLIDVDVIVYATGYHLDFLSTMEIRGRDGVTLGQEWAGNNPRAYRGGTVPGFPNLFVTSAPNANPGHGAGNNFAIEVTAHFLVECLQLLAEREATSLEPTRQAYDEYNARIDEAMERTVWRHTPSAHTYYRNDSGRVIVASPWRLIDVWSEHRAPVESHFRLK
ncbi:flavin-containing monooxygenase [Rhodococcus sp. NPDC127528]|uniref:flavin-containing monooxygenase n=1 Tax=unclassified Rhodococcus (in: high G+C Gram-positive bacteria) TaxID=192944 RepID=UPI00363358A3